MIANIVPSGVNLADIGADHGYLIKYLKENNLINHAFASDNKKGPYERLKENTQGLDIETSLSDGIELIPTDTNCVCIAGMGGDTIISIIEKSKHLLPQIEYFVLSPHSLNDEVRKYLFSNGYKLINQNCCFDPYPHYYEVNLFQKGEMEYDEIDIKYGKYLIEDKKYPFVENIKLRIEKILDLLKNSSLPIEKIEKLNSELDEYKKLFLKF